MSNRPPPRPCSAELGLRRPLLSSLLVPLGLALAGGPSVGLAQAAPPPENPAETPEKQAPQRTESGAAGSEKTRRKPRADVAKGKKGGKNAVGLARRVQRFYDRLQDFRADFVQTYTRRALSRTSESSGVLTIKKGGKVRWAYARPAEKLFVADGETLWIYEPDERQVIVDRAFSTEKLGGSIAFLWGEGKLTESFDVRTPAPETHGFEEGAAVLELVPTTDRTYERLVLEVDPATGQVRSSVVYETSGNTNRFRFTNPKINTGVPDATFEFVPPAGVDVVHARPS